MKFEYLQRVVIDGELDIDNPGSCIIRGRNDLGEEFYLFIKTTLGYTETLEYGPATPDIKELPFSITMKYNRIEYSSSRIEKLITKFLNDISKNITFAELVDLADVKSNIKIPIDNMYS